MNKIKFFFTLLGIIFLYKVNAQNTVPITFQLSPKGSSYHIFTSNTGDKIKLNDVITFDVVEKTGKDSVLFSSYVQGHPVKLQVQASQNIGDLMDIFPLLALNDSAMVKIPSDSIFVGHEDQRPPYLPKGSSVVFLLKIGRVQSLDDAIAERNKAMEAMKAAEGLAITKYVAESHKVYKTTSTGLKYIVTKPSLKPKALAGDTAYVNYTGHTVNGKVFDSSIEIVAAAAGLQQPGRKYEPIKVAIGKGEVIPGWDEALLLLNEGAKATLVIPSSLAYGEQGAGADIPGFTPLVFDLELVKVKRIHHAVKKPAATKPGVKKSATTAKKS